MDLIVIMNLFVYFINNIHVTVSILYNEIQYIHQIHENNLPLIALEIFHVQDSARFQIMQNINILLRTNI